MARQNSDAYELTDAERRDLIKLIERGDYLPEKYRYLLFKDKREVELVWNGKTRDVTTAVLPFQTLEHIDEPRKERRADEALELDMGGRQAKGWTNKLIWGDNKLILSSLKSGALRQQILDAGGIKLIYIDPPFDVGADFSVDIEIGDETFHKNANLLEQIAYRDTWGRGTDSFVSMIYERLILMRDLMHEDGVIYVHCDWHVGYAIRAILNEVFGPDNFINEIVWHYYNKMAPNSACFPRAADRILSFAKNQARYTFHQQYEKLDAPVKRLKRQFVGGKAINVRNELGEVQYIELDVKRLDDVWRIPMLQPADKTENAGYSTQKPTALVERIVRASSNEGDLVADFFCGAGTAAVVSVRLGRKWIATDLGKFGIHTTRERLIQVQRDLKAAAKPFRAFEVLNLGRYERQAYLNVSGRLTGKKKEEALAERERAFRALLISAANSS